MILYIIILIVATAAVAVLMNVEKLAQNKTIKYSVYGAYFVFILFLLYLITDGTDIPLILVFLALVFLALSLLVKGSYLAASSLKIMKVVMTALYVCGAVIAGYFLYESISMPIRFNNEKHVRYQKAIDELKRIRTAQIAYKNEHDKYSPSLDELKKFIQEGSMTVIRKEGEAPDSIFLQEGNDLEKAERKSLELGLIKRDTLRVRLMDTLFKNYDISKFGIVPFTDGQKFDMDTNSIEAGGLSVNVFEAKVLNQVLLSGMNKKLILNLNDDAIKAEHYPGLKVGSLEENNNNEGNWDKEYDLKK